MKRPPRRTYHASISIRFSEPLNERQAWDNLFERLKGTGIMLGEMHRLPRPRDKTERRCEEEPTS